MTAAALTASLAACGGDVDIVRTAPAAKDRSPDTPSPEPKSFTAGANGDILLHGILNEQARADARNGGYDYVPMLEAIKPRLTAVDLGICHMETALAPRRGPFSGYPMFNSPPHVAASMKKLGYDTCSTASNHTLDKGAAGVRRTLRTMDRVELRHAGSARTAKEARRINIMDANGVKVAQLSYTDSTNGIPLPAGKPWMVNRLEPGRVLADARRARREGAEAVILSLHWGEEYSHSASARQVSIAKRLLGSPDVDLIVGHHAHVVQPFEKINGKWVAYGLGNLVANPIANSAATHEGIFARFTFTQRGDGWDVQPEIVPTLVKGMPVRLVDLPAAVQDKGLPAAQRARYRRIMKKTARIARSRGSHVPIARDQDR